jgi:hypothetical protein
VGEILFGPRLDTTVNNVYTEGMGKKRQKEDPVMGKVRSLFKASGLSLHDLGLKMGCPPDTARQAVWQFMRTSDPHISLLRRFAAALGMPLSELVDEAGGNAKGGKSDNDGTGGKSK